MAWRNDPDPWEYLSFGERLAKGQPDYNTWSMSLPRNVQGYRPNPQPDCHQLQRPRLLADQEPLRQALRPQHHQHRLRRGAAHAAQCSACWQARAVEEVRGGFVPLLILVAV